MQHIPHGAEILLAHMLLHLLLRQPPELGQAELVILEVRLAGHDARAHEERAHAAPLELLLSRGGLLVEGLQNVVACGSVPDDPGVHVGPGGFG
jgi:hypothetical protein